MLNEININEVDKKICTNQFNVINQNKHWIRTASSRNGVN